MRVMVMVKASKESEAGELPTTATGKVQKFRLIERARTRLGRAEVAR